MSRFLAWALAMGLGLAAPGCEDDAEPQNPRGGGGLDLAGLLDGSEDQDVPEDIGSTDVLGDGADDDGTSADAEEVGDAALDSDLDAADALSDGADDGQDDGGGDTADDTDALVNDPDVASDSAPDHSDEPDLIAVPDLPGIDTGPSLDATASDDAPVPDLVPVGGRCLFGGGSDTEQRLCAGVEPACVAVPTSAGSECVANVGTCADFGVDGACVDDIAVRRCSGGGQPFGRDCGALSATCDDTRVPGFAFCVIPSGGPCNADLGGAGDAPERDLRCASGLTCVGESASTLGTCQDP
jgi:hypothetical protein